MLFILEIARETSRFSGNVNAWADVVSAFDIVTLGGAAMLRACLGRFGRGSFSVMCASVPDMFAAFLTVCNGVSLAHF